jgi:FHA domain
MEALWPGIFVAEGNLARLVAELREVIGDDAHAPRFVRTVPRFGYAFHGEVLEGGGKALGPPAPPSLYALVWGDREIALGEGEYVLGRDHHARIVIDGTAARLEDLGSKNGTFLRNQRLEGSHPLRDGDSIRLGLVALVLRRFEPGVSTETVAGAKPRLRRPSGSGS